MESKAKEMGLRNGGRLGAVKNLGLSLRLPGFGVKAMPWIPEAAYKISDDCRAHLAEVEYQKARARAEAQRVQFNR